MTIQNSPIAGTTRERTTGTEPAASQGRRRGPIGWVTVASILTGVVAALILTLVVFAGGAEHQIIGSTLLGFGLGWLTLASLSTRRTAMPQGWAYLPAAVLGGTGVAVLILPLGDSALTGAGWVWPAVAGALAIWCWVGVRRTLPDRARWLLYPVIAVIGLSAVSGMATTIQLQATANQFAMPGHTYLVNGHRLHMSCSGSGSPTVVLENALGLSSPAWARVIAGVPTTTRVCAYDRAGQAWSESAAQPQDGRAVVSDLHALLLEAGEQGPFVLAGHSAGGAYAMAYAALYPADVAGLVLLDSMSPHQFTLVPSFPATWQMIRRLESVLGPLTRVGFGPLLAESFADLPATEAAQQRAIQTRPGGYDTNRDEVSQYHQALAQAQALTTFGSRPLVVLTTTDALHSSPGWNVAQDELAQLSSNSSHRVVETSHEGVLVTAIGSDASVRAITDVVRSVQTGQPIPAH